MASCCGFESPMRTLVPNRRRNLSAPAAIARYSSHVIGAIPTFFRPAFRQRPGSSCALLASMAAGFWTCAHAASRHFGWPFAHRCRLDRYFCLPSMHWEPLGANDFCAAFLPGHNRPPNRRRYGRPALNSIPKKPASENGEQLFHSSVQRIAVRKLCSKYPFARPAFYGKPTSQP